MGEERGGWAVLEDGRSIGFWFGLRLRRASTGFLSRDFGMAGCSAGGPGLGVRGWGLE